MEAIIEFIDNFSRNNVSKIERLEKIHSDLFHATDLVADVYGPDNRDIQTLERFQEIILNKIVELKNG